MSIVYFQSFCRVIQESGRGRRLYLTVTDYTPFAVLGQTREKRFGHSFLNYPFSQEQLIASRKLNLYMYICKKHQNIVYKIVEQEIMDILFVRNSN